MFFKSPLGNTRSVMFVSSIFVWAVFASAIFGTGCSLRVKEGPPPQSADAAALGGSNTTCLAGGSQVFTDFQRGRGNDQKIDALFRCATQALETFEQRTVGEKRGVYTLDELARFLEKFFLEPGTKIDDTLLSEIKALKRVIFGGTLNTVTKNELMRARELLEVLRRSALKLRPVMPLTMDRVQSESDAWFKDATQAFSEINHWLGDYLAQTGVSYSFERMRGLFSALSRFFLNPETSVLFKNLSERVPLLSATKGVLISPDASQIRGDEWKVTLDAMTRWYFLMLKVSFLNSHHESWIFGEGQAYFYALVNDAFDLLDETLERRKEQGHVIRFEEIDLLITAFRDDDLPRGVFDEKCKVRFQKTLKAADFSVEEPFVRKECFRESLRNFTRPLFTRILGADQDGAEGRDAPGITRSFVTRLRSALSDWNVRQKLIQKTWTQSRDSFGDTTRVSLLETWKIVQQGESVSIPHRILTDLTDLFKEMAALFPETGIWVNLGFEQKNAEFTLNNLSQQNWIRMAARMLFLGYAEVGERGSPQAPSSSLKLLKSEFKNFTDDYRDFGIQMGMVDEQLYNMHDRRFMEANLFTFTGNGDEYLNLSEASELLAYMITASHRGRAMHRAIVKRCDAQAEDRFGGIQVAAPCYREAFFENFKENYSHVPHFGEYFSKLRADEKREVEKNLEIAARNFGFTQEPLESVDSETIAMMLMYMDTVFLKYDANHNDTFDLDEAEIAFPVFRQTILEAAEKLPYKSDDWLMAVFTYLLHHGKKPASDLGGFLSLTDWKIARRKWPSKVHADRSTLVSILSAFSTIPPVPRLQSTSK